MKGLEVRSGALAVLARVGRGTHLDQSVDLELARLPDLAERDRNLLTALAYQTVRHRRRLDLRIERAAKRKMARIDAELRDVLRLGAVQLFCFDSIPAHAAVDTTVELAARESKGRAKGFVNAVLREIQRTGFALDERMDPIRRLGEQHSFPDWLVRDWVQRFGLERARDFAERMNRPATLVLRPAPGEHVAELIEEIREAGFDVSPSPWIPDAIRVTGGHPARLPGWAAARYQVQDEASQAVGHLLGAGQPGECVLDACAGLGTKSVQLGERLGPGAWVLAHDPSPERLRTLAQIRLPAGAHRARIVRGRADGCLPFMDGTFPRVLVDAPCTGLGSVRRHPEIKWRRGPGSVAKHGKLQRAILEDALRVLAPGGTLVYATCTVTVEETEEVVRSVLDGRSDLRSVSCVDMLPEPLRPCVGSDGFFRSFPDFDGIDAFFAAVLRRS